jgi:Protein of unknown function (DUF1573)
MLICIFATLKGKQKSMKKYLLIIGLIFVIIYNNVYAQKLVANKTDISTEKIIEKVVEDGLTLTEKEYDFGKIPQGKPVTHTFEIINTSKDSLKIANVQASCGCTTPEWDRDKVQAAGQKTKITVGFNAASEGPFNKVITISYNGNLSKQITIRGEVWKTPVSSAPENKSLNQLKEQ